MMIRPGTAQGTCLQLVFIAYCDIMTPASLIWYTCIVPPSIVIIVSIVTSHPLPDLLLNNLDEGQKQDEIKTSF